MGYYWNALDERWHPIDHHRQLTRQQRHQINRRSRLIAALIKEIESGDNSVISLYAGLLARCLVSADQELMREYGEQVAKQEGSKPDQRVSA